MKTAKMNGAGTGINSASLSKYSLKKRNKNKDINREFDHTLIYKDFLLNNTSDHLCIISKPGNKDYIFSYANKPFAKFFNKKQDHFQGSKVKDLFTSGQYSDFFSQLEDIEPGKPVLPGKVIFNNGNKELIANKIYVKNISSEEKLFFISACSFSHKKQGDGELKNDKKLIDIFLEVSENVIIEIDNKGNLKQINNKGCILLGYEKSELIGRNWFREIVPPEISRKMVVNFNKLMRGKEPEKFYENDILTKSGEKLLIRWNSSLIKDDNGKITGLISSGEDITETRKLQNDLLEHSNNSDFLYLLTRLISESSDLDDLLNKAVNLLSGYKGMLGGKICVFPSGGAVSCNIDKSFGIYNKVFKNQDDINNLVHTGLMNNNLEITNYSHYGTKCKVYSGVYLLYTSHELQGIFLVITDRSNSFLNNFFMLIASELARAIKRKKVEIEIKLSEEKFLSVFNLTPDALAISELNTGNFFEVNAGFEELTGYSRDNVLNKSPIELNLWVNPEDRKILLDRLEQEKKLVNFFALLKHKNGKTFNASFSATELLLFGKKYMLTAVRDITKQINIENEIRETKQLLEKITFTTPSIICLHDVKKDKILYNNKSLLGSLGYSNEDIEVIKKLGKNWKDSFYHPDDMDKIDEFDKRMKHIKDGEISSIEYRIKNAKSKWEWFQQRAEIFQKGSDNEPILTINIFDNITGRKEAEEEVEKHHKEIELLYQAGKEISSTLSLYEIYDKMYKIISQVADCKELIVVAYDPKNQLIVYKYLMAKATSERVDVSNIPPVPLAPKGYGIVSEVIRTGESIIIDDYDKYFKKVKTRYVINQFGTLTEDEQGSETPRSAMILPIKLEGKILGAVQIYSNRYSAYNTEQLKFVESLLNQVALANRNATIFEQAQHEIAERKQAQEELKRSEKNLRQFAESVPDVLYRLNYETGKYDFLSPVIVNMLGYDIEDILSDPNGFSRKVTHPDDVDFVYYSIINFLKHGRVEQPITIECRMFRKDGKMIWVRDSIKFEYKNGKVYAAIGAISDITEKKNIEEQRRRRDEMIIKHQSALLELSIMEGHDINTNFRKVTENATGALNVDRASIWLFDEKDSVLECKDAFIKNTATHESGEKISLNEYRDLLKILKSDDRIISSRVEDKNDSINKFSRNYLIPHGTHFSLITQIRYQGKVSGILCIETSDLNKSEWSPEEFDFAVSVSGFISLALESKERYEAEEEIKRSLKDKEMLLREIHHRVKNNLQVISSIMFLQSKKSTDANLKDAFLESQNRIKSMVMIHEKLYRSENLANFNYSEYIKDLANSLFRSYRLDTSMIELKLDVGNIILDTDTAVHCGLIINELVSNSIKHAFPAGKHGAISISFQNGPEESYKLVISDNGVGLSNEFAIESKETLGMQLVGTLVEQLHGQLDIINDNGTRFEISFSLKN